MAIVRASDLQTGDEVTGTKDGMNIHGYVSNTFRMSGGVGVYLRLVPTKPLAPDYALDVEDVAVIDVSRPSEWEWNLVMPPLKGQIDNLNFGTVFEIDGSPIYLNEGIRRIRTVGGFTVVYSDGRASQSVSLGAITGAGTPRILIGGNL